MVSASAPTASAWPVVLTNRTVYIWDAATGRQTLTLKGHNAHVNGVCFSPDGNRLASASRTRDSQAVGRHDGREEFTLRGLDNDAFYDVCFSPDGKQLAGASMGDGDDVGCDDGPGASSP